MAVRTSDDEHFFLALMEAADRVRSFVDVVQSRVGLTGGEYALLRVVEQHPDCTAAEVAQRLRIKDASVAEVVARLEKRRLLQRFSDPLDARRRRMRLTEKGLGLVQHGRTATMQAIHDLRLPRAELASLTRSLRSFLSSLPPYGQE